MMDITNQTISDVVLPMKLRVIEMVNEHASIDVPVDSRIDISTITGDDSDPKFVNVEIIRARTSGNNRRYSNMVVKEVNDMTPGVQAFLGHPDPNKHGFEFREPQGIFVGSVLEQMIDGVYRSIGKCYLFRTSPLREWVPKSIAAGNPMTVSINGSADVIRNGEFMDVVHITELQSIDWANPGTEGMDTSQAMSVVTELQNNISGGNDMGDNNQPTAKDIISNVTVAEFRAYNSDGYNAILKGITVQELASINPTVVDQIKESAKVTEMNLTIGGKQETVKVSELQSTITGFETRIAELNEKFESAKLTEYKTRKLGELVPDAFRDKIANRITGKTEAEIDKSIDTEIAYVREMGGLNNPPVGSQEKKQDTDTVRDAVYSAFGNRPKQ